MSYVWKEITVFNLNTTFSQFSFLDWFSECRKINTFARNNTSSTKSSTIRVHNTSTASGNCSLWWLRASEHCRFARFNSRITWKPWSWHSVPKTCWTVQCTFVHHWFVMWGAMGAFWKLKIWTWHVQWRVTKTASNYCRQ